MTTVIPTSVPPGQMYHLLANFYSRKQKWLISSFVEPSLILVKIGTSFGRSLGRPVGYARILIEPREEGSNVRFLFNSKIYYIITLAFEMLAATSLLTIFLPNYLRGQSLYELAILVIVILAIVLFPYFNISGVKETKSKFIAETNKCIKQATSSEV